MTQLPNSPNEFIRCCDYKTMIPKTAGKYKSVTSIDLVNQCLKICSWIPLTMVKSLLLDSASAYSSVVIKKFSEILYSLRNPLTFADSTYILRNPLTFADSTYILRRNPLTVAESRIRAIFPCCRIRNKINVPNVTNIYTRNRRKSCKGNPLTFWNMFKYLCLESRNIQTQNCAQCTVWPRNVTFSFSCYYCSTDFKRQSEYSGPRPDTSSLVFSIIELQAKNSFSNHAVPEKNQQQSKQPKKNHPNLVYSLSEKRIRRLFFKFGVVGEKLMKNFILNAILKLELINERDL